MGYNPEYRGSLKLKRLKMNQSENDNQKRAKEPFLTKKKIFLVLSLTLIAGLSYIYWPQKPQKSETITSTEDLSSQQYSFSEGGESSDSNAKTFSTSSQATIESQEIKLKSKPNAAVISWKVRGSDNLGDSYSENQNTELLVLEVQVKDNGDWQEWRKIEPDDPGKDQTSPDRKALVIANSISDIRYRFKLISPGGGEKSPEVDLTESKLELIDTTKGPSLSSNFKDSVKNALSLNLNKVSAAGAPPRIISRAEWGSPEPNSSTRWDIEYRPLNRGYLHHTAQAANANDTAASVRAIWNYHANTLGWGDIGYSYLVDIHGNIFQGRYTDDNYARENWVDIVAGHAYGANYGSVGVSALGNFVYETPSAAMLESLSNIFAYKFAKYNLDPTGWYGNLPVLIAHRDTHPTACPGDNMYARLGDIRNRAAQLVSYYKPYHDSLRSDYEIISRADPKSYLYQEETSSAIIKIKNTSTETWYPDGNLGAGQHPLRLVTQNSSNTNFADTDSAVWLGTQNSIMMQGASPVAPGGTAEFKIDFKSPSPAITSAVTISFKLDVVGVKTLKGKSPITFNFQVPPKLKVNQAPVINVDTSSGRVIHSLVFNISPDPTYGYSINLDPTYGLGSKLSLVNNQLVATQDIQPGTYNIKFNTEYRSLTNSQVLEIKILPGGYQPVYRFWSGKFNGHFYTISEAEKNDVVRRYPDVWSYETIAWYALPLQNGNCPAGYNKIYRFWSGSYNHHFYTASESEKNHVLRNWPNVWQYEGPQYCVQTGAGASSNQPVYRFWSGKLNGHFYTADGSEKNHVIRTWPEVWSYEGEHYWVYKQS
jgi:hypothetical protein